MKSIVGVYETHEAAVEALNVLKQENFNMDTVSLMAKADLIDDHITVKSTSSLPEVAEVSIGLVAGTVMGVLSGVGVFAIPGLGFLFGAGALIGGAAGANLGLVGGGLAAFLTRLGINKASTEKYEKHLNEGKFILFVQAEEQEQERAHKLLNTTDLDVELDRG